MTRSTLAALAVSMLLGASAHAVEFRDVIVLQLNEGCTAAQYQAITDDFNAYYKDRGYQAELLVPVHGQPSQGTLEQRLIWVGSSPNAEAFGKAYDHWLTEQPKSGSAVSKLSERFTKCAETTSRASYNTTR